jgi:hypothetical protein
LILDLLAFFIYLILVFFLLAHDWQTLQTQLYGLIKGVTGFGLVFNKPRNVMQTHVLKAYRR